MSVYPGVIVDWCITAKVKGKGKPQRFQIMDQAAPATSAVIAWLNGMINPGGYLLQPGTGNPRIDVEAELTSEQLPGWVHTVKSEVEGMPAPEAVEYTNSWLVTVAEMDNWGSGP